MKGLTNQEVEQSRQKYGSNTLTPPKRESLLKLFFEKFNDPIIRILLIAAFLSLGISIVHNEYYETIGIFVAIFLATGVAFWFEMDAQKKFDILNQVNDDTPVKVYRDGKLTEVGKKDIVVGDYILLETGEEIPADCELIHSIQLTVNESTLTGEPSTSKSHEASDFDNKSTYPTNHILRGTNIIEGNAEAQVIRVGDATEFGKVAKESTTQVNNITPLTKQLDKLAKLIGVIGFTLAGLTFLLLFFKDVSKGYLGGLGQVGLVLAVIGGVFIALTKVWFPIIFDGISVIKKQEREVPKWISKSNWLVWLLSGLIFFIVIALIGRAFGVDALNREHWINIEEAGKILQYFMVAVTLIVVAVPEGLPMSVTLALALSMRRMLKSNNLVRKMHACETMGAATVICTDKTGTLTQNRMTLNELILIDENEELFHSAIAVNTSANIDADGKPLGNPTEGALLLWLDKQGVDYSSRRVDIISQIPFSSKLKMMATVAKVNGQTFLFVKGAPEFVLAKCEQADYSEIKTKLTEFQNRAMRTLAFAYRIVDGKVDDLSDITDMRLQAVTAISDPIREDVPGAIRECRNAGIEIKMITGDTSATAKEIGRQVGLWGPEDSAINEITGPEWEALTDEEAYKRAQHIKIMSRARPTDKQRLVQMLQKHGEVVAVTGDGTNDAPALNFADVGLSMGTGTSVAKEASDITLLDDSFASIANAVMWGRSVYLNIQRFILFQLTINVAAILLVFLGALLNFEQPITVIQMLWINLIMDTLAAGALASLPPDRKVMKNKPRSVKDLIITPVMQRSILSIGIIFVVGLLALLYYFSNDAEGFIRYEMSLFFTIFVMLQLWNMFNAKAYQSGHSALHGMSKSQGFVLVLFIILLGQIVIVTFGGDVFRVAPLEIKDWLIVIGTTSVVLWFGEIVRGIGRLTNRKLA